MTVCVETTPRSFVLLPMGTRRIAFAADFVVELASPQRLQNFPHKTPWISGVIVQHNRIVPVYDANKLFNEPDAPGMRFYLIVEWKIGESRDLCAIPVAGECELVSTGSMTPAKPELDENRPFVAGLLSIGPDEIEVIDLREMIWALRATGESAS